MFNLFKDNKIKIINKYSDPEKIKNLLLKIFNVKDKKTPENFDTQYENNNIKIIFSQHSRDGFLYKVYVKQKSELVEVFNRVSNNGIEVKVFVVGDWIYQLYLVSKKKISSDDLVDLSGNHTLTVSENDKRFKKIE